MKTGLAASIVVLLAAATLAADSPPLAIAPFDAPQARVHQDAWAKHVGQPLRATNSLGMTLILIPPGPTAAERKSFAVAVGTTSIFIAAARIATITSSSRAQGIPAFAL